jgi:hypothetical protein
MKPEERRTSNIQRRSGEREPQITQMNAERKLEGDPPRYGVSPGAPAACPPKPSDHRSWRRRVLAGLAAASPRRRYGKDRSYALREACPRAILDGMCGGQRKDECTMPFRSDLARTSAGNLRSTLKVDD